jgi:hypothetical protein
MVVMSMIVALPAIAAGAADIALLILSASFVGGATGPTLACGAAGDGLLPDGC